MTTNPSNTSRPARPGQLPWWLVVCIVVLCLGGGVWAVKMYLGQQDEGRVIKLTDTTPGGPNFDQPYQSPSEQLERSVRPLGATKQYDLAIYQSEITNCLIRVTNNRPTFIINANINRIGTPATRQMLAMHSRLRTEAGVRRAVSLTATQTRELNKLDSSMSLVLTPAAEKALADAWNAYMSAPAGAKKDAAVAAFRAMVIKLAPDIIKNTNTEWEKRATAIRAILKPDQIDAYENMGRPRPQTNRPTNPPAPNNTNTRNNTTARPQTPRPAATTRPAATSRPAATPATRPTTRSSGSARITPLRTDVMTPKRTPDAPATQPAPTPAAPAPSTTPATSQPTH